LIPGLVAEIALLLKLTILSAASPPQITTIQFVVTDPRSELTQSLGPHLLLKVHRAVDAHRQPYGWDIAVIDYLTVCAATARSPTIFYAWHFREMFFPPKRILPVYGYPFEILVECKDCQVDRSSATEMHFTAGIVEVAWRRLQKSNPRQRTLADFR
jgi:hypothetical protein